MAIIHPNDPIRVVVSVPMISTEPNISLAELAAKLDKEQVGALAVMRGDHLDGLISERDIVRALAAQGDPADVWAADVMAEDPVRVDGEDSILTAAALMLDEGVRHLAVMRDGHVLGLVSVRDVLRVLVEEWRWRADDER